MLQASLRVRFAALSRTVRFLGRPAVARIEPLAARNLLPIASSAVPSFSSLLRPPVPTAPYPSVRTSLGTMHATAVMAASAARRGKKYKLKTHSGAKKRWRLTGSRKFRRYRAGKQHLNYGKRKGQLNRLKKSVFANSQQARRLKRLMPYG